MSTVQRASSDKDITFTGALPMRAPRDPAVNQLLAAIRGADNLGLAVYPKGGGKLISAHGTGRSLEEIKMGEAVAAVLKEAGPVNNFHNTDEVSTFELNPAQLEKLLPVFAYEPDRIFSLGGRDDREGTHTIVARLESARQRG